MMKDFFYGQSKATKPLRETTSMRSENVTRFRSDGETGRCFFLGICILFIYLELPTVIKM